MDMAAGGASVGMSTQRDLWRQARQQISEYEHKMMELQLDLQQEAKGMRMAKDDLEQVIKENIDMNKQATAAERYMIEADMRLLTLQKTAMERSLETTRLAHQLECAKQQREKNAKKLAAIRAMHQNHLAEQRDTNDKYQKHLKDQGLQQHVV